MSEEKVKQGEVMQKQFLTISHKQTDIQPVSEQQLPPRPASPHWTQSSLWVPSDLEYSMIV